jgi:hypothetical protein
LPAMPKNNANVSATSTNTGSRTIWTDIGNPLSK